MKDTPFRKGDPLLADDLEGMRQLLIRVLKVAPPLQVSNTATGIYISTAGGDGGIVAGVFTVINPDGEDFPEEGDDPCPYWAQQQLSPSFDEDEELDAEYENGETGEDTLIFNLSEDHIPVGARLLCWKINGHWWTFYRAVSGIRVVEGVLTSNLSSGGTATMNVWDKDHTVTGEIITVRDRAGWAGTSGQYIKAIRCGNDFEYRPDVIGCVAQTV